MAGDAFDVAQEARCLCAHRNRARVHKKGRPLRPIPFSPIETEGIRLDRPQGSDGDDTAPAGWHREQNLVICLPGQRRQFKASGAPPDGQLDQRGQERAPATVAHDDATERLFSLDYPRRIELDGGGIRHPAERPRHREAGGGEQGDAKDEDLDPALPKTDTGRGDTRANSQPAAARHDVGGGSERRDEGL